MNGNRLPTMPKLPMDHDFSELTELSVDETLATLAKLLSEWRPRVLSQPGLLHFYYLQRLVENTQGKSTEVKQALIPRIKRQLTLVKKALDKLPETAPEKYPVHTQANTGHSPLTALIREICNSHAHRDRNPDGLSLADELLQQEHKIKQTLKTDNSSTSEPNEPLGQIFADNPNIRKLREALERGQTEKLIRETLKLRPESPGPLNPERLLLQTLESMQALSPSYLNRFAGYAQTLAWLEHIQPRPSSSTGPDKPTSSNAKAKAKRKK